MSVERYAIFLCDGCAKRPSLSCNTLGCAFGPDIAAKDTVSFADAVRDQINTPHTGEFFLSVRLEAAHQVERWGTEHDAAKEPTDWFWLLGYLSGKAVSTPEKRKHHIISSAAVLLNWYRRETGDDTLFQPGDGSLSARSGA